jgi:bifunctional UDP-N-acetylglucosamine pyrophosphorylase/glucosamine-1-phosphate N-acetyltransferase
MRSALPKVLLPLAVLPMIQHLIGACADVFGRLVVVVGPDMPALEDAVAPREVVVQRERLGTGHAALQAAPLLGGHQGDVAVLYGDNPLISAATLQALVAARQSAGLVLLAMRPADAARYGRVVLDAKSEVARIVEWADATAEERAIGLCNAGVICAPAGDLFRWLGAIGNNNAKGEYYLTDVIQQARAEGKRVVAVEAPEAELRGINSRAELAQAEAEVQRGLRAAAMAGGVTMLAPETVHLSHDTRLGADVLLEPNIFFGPDVTVEDGVTIRAFSHLEGCVVKQGAVIGPYARLRPGSIIETHAHVGNFVELKATTLGAGAKANHLSYLGDAMIGAGAGVLSFAFLRNIPGAGRVMRSGSGMFVSIVLAALAGVGVAVTTKEPLAQENRQKYLALDYAGNGNVDGSWLIQRNYNPDNKLFGVL